MYFFAPQTRQYDSPLNTPTRINPKVSTTPIRKLKKIVAFLDKPMKPALKTNLGGRAS
jgi:hypothetical protein